MRIDKISAANRKQHLASSDNQAINNPFFKWNDSCQQYDFAIEIRGIGKFADERFVFIGSQLEWEELNQKMNAQFAKAPA